MRVGFQILPSYEWLGGINYYRNLFTAIAAFREGHIEPVVFTSSDLSSDLKDVLQSFPNIELVPTSLLQRVNITAILRKVGLKAFHRDYFINSLFERYHVDALSHSCINADNISIPMMGWIPDFQHCHLPNFFSAHEIEKRGDDFAALCNYSQLVLLSSVNAKEDLQRFYPQAAAKARVLHFVAQSHSLDASTTLEELQERYHFTGSYFYLPNQFWTHKNHRAVIDALAILKSRGKDITILASGNTNDYRQPGYFSQLMDYAKERDVLNEFRVLGIVPYQDLVGLMRYAVAVINPSLFEGWSTTVEEAKAMGKLTILSDIAVHREQNPKRGIYFDSKEPEELADILAKSYRSFQVDEEKQFQQEAANEWPQRQRKFIQQYLQIVTELTGKV